MSGFRDNGPIVKRRPWEGAQVKARVVKHRSGKGWQVEVASSSYMLMGDNMWRRYSSGVTLPFTTKTRWISQQLVNVMNAFFKSFAVHLDDGRGGSF